MVILQAHAAQLTHVPFGYVQANVCLCFIQDGTEARAVDGDCQEDAILMRQGYSGGECNTLGS